MTRKQAIKLVLSHFKNGDKYNQLRPGETTLAIECFIQGFRSMLMMTEEIKLSQEDFDAVIEELENHFDQFVDSKTTTREVA